MTPPQIITPAHEETEHLTIVRWRPEHAPRATDPHYHIFTRTRGHMKAAGKLVCWVCGSTTDIQVHHHLVEFSMVNGVDIVKFSHLWPLLHVETVEEFLQLVETDPNLLALCQLHHTGEQGIHFLPYPDWLPLAYWKAGLPIPAHLLRNHHS